MGKKAPVIEQEVKKLVDQGKIDGIFQAYMDREYQEHQIGDLQDDEGVNPKVEGLNSNEGEEEENEEYFDYGELSDGDFDVQSDVKSKATK